MIRCVFIIGWMTSVLANGYKHNFNINLSIADDNGNVQVSSVKVTSPNERASSTQPTSQNTPSSYNGYGINPSDSNYSQNTRVNDQVKSSRNVDEVRYNDQSKKNVGEAGSRNSTFRQTLNRFNGITPSAVKPAITPSYSGYGKTSITPSDSSAGVAPENRRHNKPSTPIPAPKAAVTPSTTRYNRTNVPAAGSSTKYRNSVTNNSCIMNQINCSLTGATGEKLSNCLSCANFIYHSTSCDKYEPSSFLSLFSKNDYKPSLKENSSRSNSNISSMLEIENVDDFKTEGLTPLNIEPKVSVHDLLYSYDNQNHVKPRDPYCNDVRCVRLRDPQSCISQLPAQNQYTCGSCWIFANTLHLEILMCMESNLRRVRRLSEMYISSCLNMSSKNPCSGGNTYLYSQIISQYQFIPSKDDLKYDVPVMDTCPRWESHWNNQKPTIELLSPENNKLNSFRGFILIKRHEYDNSEEFINLIKDMVKEKGSAVISMKGVSVLKPDHDGTKVLKLCHHNQGTHAMVIIGYGTYIDENSEKRRYWHIRNSWGPNWGDNGNFKLDMDGPDGCNGNVFEYAVVLNVKMHKNTSNATYGYVPEKINNIGNGKTKKISVKYGDKVYSRIFFEEENGLNNRYNCNRVFSINKNKNEECVSKCKRNLKECSEYGPKDIGACLFSIDHDFDCMMCGV